MIEGTSELIDQYEEIDVNGMRTSAAMRQNARHSWFSSCWPREAEVGEIRRLDETSFVQAWSSHQKRDRVCVVRLLPKAFESRTLSVRVISEVAKRPLDEAIGGLLDGELPRLEATVRCEKRQRSVQFANVSRSIPACVAYDRDGKRAEVCASIDANSPRVDLSAKRCPRWVMPNAGGAGIYRTVWTKPLVDQLLAKGWPSLTQRERQTIFGELEDAALRLAIFIATVTKGGAESVLSEPSYLRGVAKYVPEDLRPRFNAWVRAKYGARARGAHFSVREADGNSTRDEQLEVVQLVALAQDAELAKQAAPLAATYRDLPPGSWPQDWYARPVLMIAANADPRFSAALLEQLATPDSSGSGRRYDVIAALSDVRNIAGLVMIDPAKFYPWELRQLLANTCDAAGRAEISKLPKTNLVRRLVLASIDSCIATRKRLDPMFRAWLRKVAAR